MRDKNPQQNAPTLLTVKETARLLRLSQNSVYQGVKGGSIPGLRRVGRTIRVHRPTLLRWLEQGEA